MKVQDNTMKLLLVVILSIMSFISPVAAHRRQQKLARGQKLFFTEGATQLSKPDDASTKYAGTFTNQPLLNNVEPFMNSKGEEKRRTQLPYQTNKVVSLGKKDSERKRYFKRHRSLTTKANIYKPAAADEAGDVAGSEGILQGLIEKGIDMVQNLVHGEQEEDPEFSKKEIKLDITPDKGWKSEDMFVPSGYHVNMAVTEDEEPAAQEGEEPYGFPAGIGEALINGCWGTGYKINDPCFNAKTTEIKCDDMMEGAGFLGVGFDGRGKYSPDSRKMSLIQRNCANEATYAGEDVPDTMNVHGIYDTSASLITFESRAEYSKFLQQEAGISGSYFGFSAQVQEAWGESSESSSQKFLAVMDVDVSRYEIFMDEVKPNDLSLSFLREFMNLPLSYFSAGAPLLYQNFIQRWGTHYIKSAKFGGQLEIRKAMDAKDAKSKKEFSAEMEMEYKNLFASVSAKGSVQTGESSRKQSKTTSTSILAQGGSQEIASILSDVYSPTFKTEFKHWLQTIPSYPKAFKFQMGSITDLLNFRANDLFPDEKVQWGCEGNAVNLKTEMKDGKKLIYYEVVDDDGTKIKHYCEFDSRQALENAIKRRRTSLLRAMEIYMQEGPISISDTELAECSSKRRDNGKTNDMPRSHPSWKQIINGNLVFNISFDMLIDLNSSVRTAFDLGRNTSRLLRFREGKWHTSDRYGKFHLYGAFDNGDSKDMSKSKISVFGLVLTYNEDRGTLTLLPEDYDTSMKYFLNLMKKMTGLPFARLEMRHSKKMVKREAVSQGGPAKPCKVYWSNALRFDPTDNKGKCLHFTASTGGTLFVVFAALPKDDTTWYYVEISPAMVAIHKGAQIKTQTTNVNARGLGDYSLHQSYFICITETEISTVIEYGKSLGTSDSGDVYLNFIDSTNHLNVRFYAFGNDENPAKVMDVHIVSRSLTQADCKGDTTRDRELDICVQKCHPYCNPLAGCKKPDDPMVPQGCYACRVALDAVTKKCIPKCPESKVLTRNKTCIPSMDVQLTPSENYGPVEIGDVPTLRELTLCLWLKIEGTWLKQGAKGIYLVRYEQDSLVNYFQFYLDEASTYSGKPQQIVLEFVLGGSGGHREFLDGLDDGRWQQLCVTWSGYTAVVRYYRNGNRLYSSEFRVGEIKGGGTMKIGGLLDTGTGKRSVTLHVTGVNLWDRVLSDQEIADNSKKCNDEEGTAKEWHKWYDAAKAKSGYHSSPSACRPLRT